LCPTIFSVLVKSQCCKNIASLYDTIAEALKEKHPGKKEYWQNELKSLGIQPNRQNELNDKEELQALAEIIKEVYFQDYKTAYSGNINEKNINSNNITAPHPKKG
jgi:hypothetical protein